MQKEFFGKNSIEKLKEILEIETFSKIFLVTGKNSYSISGAKEKINYLLSKFEVIHFTDFENNPKLEDIKKGIKLFKENNCDLTITIGGGSPIDVAKSINILSVNKESPDEYIQSKKKLKVQGKKVIAIPTTAGSGSESTHFAVIYINKIKYSLSHESMLPNYSIVDPSLTLSLSKYQTACTGMDALSQAIESFWSTKSTEESREYSKEAIKLALESLEGATNSPTKENKENMAKASHLAGKAINISKTTACHSISYPITSHFNVPHGHAVALTLGEMLVLNSKVSDENIQDTRGIDYVKSIIEEINILLGTNSPEESKNKIKELIKNIGLKTKLSELKINDIELIIKGGFNPERVKNNPVKLREEELREILREIS
jgi:alcohol dehydrogenase